jgi:cytochrome c5
VNPEHHDKTFVATFLLVLGFLGAFTVGILFIANVLSAKDLDDPQNMTRVAERIKPVGQVITDEKMLLAVAPPAAARAPMTGAEIVTKVCGACHGTGVLNAPKIGDKGAWAKLKGTGIKTLVGNAVKGKNAMPPRGGDPSLSDGEVQAAIEEMLKQTGV